ncbi:unnamed protein product [Rotaria sordida]|uniref:Uncharacterized protein n=1 Tax=Rotaria sordida TaxID=392033 RepID=A0A815FF03_9BILA|nr:unnamed protein product [Rotaria sordida]CAF1372003.1 unnamed protein product [Rotaria sordida]CAF3980591.1 unnamed protein product [Rotaria sordida]CAF4058634.1 unnamed protein product [Rotaria sordida]
MCDLCSPKQVAAIASCKGCAKHLCRRHFNEHRENLTKGLQNVTYLRDNVLQELERVIDSALKPPGHNNAVALLKQIDEWKTRTIERVTQAANDVRETVERLFSRKAEYDQIRQNIHRITKELREQQDSESFVESDIDRWMNQLKQLQTDFNQPLEVETNPPVLQIQTIDWNATIKITPSEKQKKGMSSLFRDEEPEEAIISPSVSPTDGGLPIKSSQFHSQEEPYPSFLIGLNESIDREIGSLLKNLMCLAPMDKNGPMNGQCGPQTDQMEQFLSDAFGFKNILGKDIFPGIKSFQLDKPLHGLNSNTQIHFPRNMANSFTMTVQEIIDWQYSYKVYADKTIKGINKEFLNRALQGQSQDGEEAFRMKYVVRISKCPILMEFDAKIISRNVNEDWPNRIKLVSAIGIDFAGRKHDVDDILYYISNWKELYYIDQRSNLPLLSNERDFYAKATRPRGELYEERVRSSLIRMTRLRLRACDEEGVQIIVETGIGLGVFSGSHIGIDAKVRALSAEAIRIALEQDGPLYKNIRAIVFALPIFNKNKSKDHHLDAFNDFVNEFRRVQYNGPIPVLIIDQDMHRVTVAIARHGFTVAEVNPADSYGVFGSYWQNPGQSVQGKLALTTVGLLVQHHLINPFVLDTNNYHLLEINEGPALGRRIIVSDDNE